MKTKIFRIFILITIFSFGLIFNIQIFEGNSLFGDEGFNTFPFSTYKTDRSDSISSNLKISEISQIDQSIEPVYEDEISNFEFIKFTEIMEDPASNITIVAMENDYQGNTYLLGNFATDSFNFAQTDLLIRNFPLSFISGTTSLQASFFLIFYSNETLKDGILLDFDDDFDYSFVSFENDDNGSYYFLAERNYIGIDVVTNGTDITIFKYNNSLHLEYSNSFGGEGDDIFGIKSKTDQQPFADLLEIDSDGNLIIAGKSNTDIIDPSSVVINPPKFREYELSMDFEQVGPISEVLMLYNNETHRNYTLDLLAPFPLNITTVDCSVYNPSLQELLEYQVVILAADVYLDQVVLGNVLADYVDVGGGLIVAANSFVDGSIEGRLKTSPYLPLNSPLNDTFPTDIDPSVSNNLHPVFDQVNSFSTTTSMDVTLDVSAKSLIYYNTCNGKCIDMVAVMNTVMAWNFIIGEGLGGDAGQFMFNSIQYIGKEAAPSINNVLVIHDLIDHYFYFRDIFLIYYITNNNLNVTQWDSASGTPSLGDLVNYDVVILMSTGGYAGGGYADRDAMGDVLANYVDIGGKVIVTPYSFQFNTAVGGRLYTDNYLPLTTFSEVDEIQYINEEEFTHPIFDDYWTFRPTVSRIVDVNPNAIVLGRYTHSGIEPSIAVLDNVLAWNFYPGVFIDDAHVPRGHIMYRSIQWLGKESAPIKTAYSGVNFSIDWEISANSQSLLLPPYSGSNIATSIGQDNNITLTNPVNYVSTWMMIPDPVVQPIIFQAFNQFGEKVNETVVNTSIPLQKLELQTYYASMYTLRMEFNKSDMWAIDDLYLNATRTPIMESSFLLKLNASLDLIWARNLPGDNESIDKIYVSSLAVDSQNKIYYSGSTQTRFYTLGDSTPFSSYNIHSGGTGFLVSFTPNGEITSGTTLGGTVNDIIYDIAIDENDTLYVSGKTMSPQITLPATIFPEVLLPGNGSGFIARMNTNWNIYSYNRIGDTNLTVDGSAIFDIIILNDYVFLSGYYNYSSGSIGFAVEGPLAVDSIGAPYGKIPMIGILDSTQNFTYTSLFTDSLSLGSNYFSPLAVHPINWEIMQTYKSRNLAGSTFLSSYKLGITDSDKDGLADHNELYKYRTNYLSNDTDLDGLYDSIEIYKYLTDPNNPDTDSDCLPDLWELENGFIPTFYDSSGDTDNDGLTNLEEILIGTNSSDADSDHDGIDDYDELNIYRTNATNADSDFDGLNDSTELFNVGTDPKIPDTDLDGLTDYFEYNYLIVYNDSNGDLQNGTVDPLNADTDGDGLTDGDELLLSLTLPFDPDSDDDGISDYDEFTYSTSDPVLFDSDADGLNDSYELFITLTNPNEADSDFDGLDDNLELFTYNTDPWLNDSDSDGLTDGMEILTVLSDPWLPDSDFDGLLDSIEMLFGSNSTNNDTDGDLLPDFWEFTYGFNSSINETFDDFDSDGLSNLFEYYNFTHPKDADPDNDNFNDTHELINGTDPWNWDTDGDGLKDGDEVDIYGTHPLYRDTDGDQLTDSEEIFLYNTDPLLRDTDSDGLNDYEEVIVYDLSASLNDTDNDNITDYVEVTHYLTNPWQNDSDFDGLDDYQEIFVTLTDPNDSDEDDDELMDGEEINLGYDPFDPDMDMILMQMVFMIQWKYCFTIQTLMILTPIQMVWMISLKLNLN
ncbi:MAG: hypothetical protein ACXAC7_03710 [Candidatus Hodarchaeales archaeon]|jgi:hypothetical protein